MSDRALPRQTYKTTEHDQIEREVARRFAKWTRSTSLKIGTDPHDKQKARVDRAFCRGGNIVAFAEIKSCSAEFGTRHTGWAVGLDKVESCRALFQVVRVPVLIIVKFGCGTVAYLDCNTEFERIERFGRSDRNDPVDYEVGARFQWSRFKVVK